ncbi:MAG TPA: hypothetical protein VHB68_09460 [Steroidobacteraceae bacterium]|nr:hypothetical protein [Steroidobacteraceae bacterium]
MPTNRTRRRRTSQYSGVVQALLDQAPVEHTPEARKELLNIWFFGWSDYPENPKLPDAAYARLQELGWLDGYG